MKTLALDLGDRWVGSAISDTLGITCKPYKTADAKDIESFLKKVIEEEEIEQIVVGCPQTFSDKESEQTRKIILQKKDLEKKFSNIKWILWDERLSSKRAQGLQTLMGKKQKDKQTKVNSHSVAAAFILQSYLDKLAFNR